MSGYFFLFDANDIHVCVFSLDNGQIKRGCEQRDAIASSTVEVSQHKKGSAKNSADICHHFEQPF